MGAAAKLKRRKRKRKMRRYTTPTLRCTLKNGKTKEPLINIEFDYLMLTLSGNNGVCINKQIEPEQYDQESGTFEVRLDQEDTGDLEVGQVLKAQVNIIIGADRFATNIGDLQVKRNLYNQIILT